MIKLVGLAVTTAAEAGWGGGGGGIISFDEENGNDVAEVLVVAVALIVLAVVGDTKAWWWYACAWWWNGDNETECEWLPSIIDDVPFMIDPPAAMVVIPVLSFVVVAIVVIQEFIAAKISDDKLSSFSFEKSLFSEQLSLPFDDLNGVWIIIESFDDFGISFVLIISASSSSLSSFVLHVNAVVATVILLFALDVVVGNDVVDVDVDVVVVELPKWESKKKNNQ